MDSSQIPKQTLADILTRAFGSSPAEVADDPALAQKHVREAIRELMGTAQSESTADSPQLEPVRSFARRVREQMLAHGIDAPSGIENLPDRIAAWSAQPQPVMSGQLAEALRRIATFLEKPNQPGTNPGDLVAWLETNLGPLIETVEDRKSRQKAAEQKDVDLRQSIRNSLRESLRAKGIEPAGE